MDHSPQRGIFLPKVFPMMSIGKKINVKPVLKAYKDQSGKQQICIRLYQNGITPQYIPVYIKISEKYWNQKKGRCVSDFNLSHDYNLLIEQVLSKINTIQIAYRLTEQLLSVRQLKKEVTSTVSRIDFITFWSQALEVEKNVVQESTYRQQLASLRKLKKFCNHLSFSEITEDWLKKMVGFLKNTLKNQDSTVSTWLKNFKKYLKIANDQGIRSPLLPEDVKVKQYGSNRVFLNKEELNQIDDYYKSQYISKKHNEVITHFLFCCYTGIRISDFWNLTKDNFVNNSLVIWNQKGNKPQTIKLNETAISLSNHSSFFNRSMSEQKVNIALKEIATIVGITKNLHFHISRHTFAMQFLLNGGALQHLQRLLGHTKIETTMIYVHIVDDLENEEIMAMDNILKKPKEKYQGMRIIK